jgi:hypothetical protein
MQRINRCIPMKKSILILLTIALIIAISPVALAFWTGGSTDTYNYNPFEEEVGVESTQDFTMLLLILIILVMILYKGEVTLENLIKIKQRRIRRKLTKKKKKSVKKRVKKKYGKK